VSRAIVVTLNGVYQQIGHDFITKGHSIVFKQAPGTGCTVDITAISGNKQHRASYATTASQTTFHLPAYPKAKFEVIPHTSKDWVPKGYVVVDVDNEIDLWIRDNCPISDWKWGDQLAEDHGTFGMTRLVVKESIVTYIATRWSE
jgi:hypothetical protein